MGPINMVFLLFGLLSTSLATNCPGCPFDQDVNSPSVISNLKLILTSTKASAEGVEGETTEVLRITKATSQVVSGLKHTYDFEAKGEKTNNVYQCHLVVVYKPWLGETKVMEYNCKPLKQLRNKRGLPGAPFELKTDDETELPRVKGVIAEELNKLAKSEYLMGIVKVFRATKQIVAGELYKLQVEVAKTNCLASSTSTLQDCEFQKKEHQVCDVEVWDQAWLQKTQVTVHECNEVPHFCAGCPIEQPASNKEAHMSLQRTIFKLNTQPGATKIWKLHQIKKVTSQVVAGVKYAIDYEAEDENKIVYNCKAVILLQPWLSDEPALMDFDCLPVQNKQ